MNARAPRGLVDEVTQHRRRVAHGLQRWGMSLRVFKLFSYLFRFMGLVLAFTAVHFTAFTPTTPFWAFVGAMVLGPDAVEAYLANGK